MDRLEAMSLVLAVAEAGSLSAAARRQHAPLATVSRKISDLEGHLQTKLFHRSSRSLVLTDTGLSYVAAAKRILADVAEAERAASGEYTTPRGELAISAPVGLGRMHLLPVVADFLKAYPAVDVHLGLADRMVNLAEEHVDLALRIGILADSTLIAVRLGDIRRVFVASPAYLKARGTPAAPEDLHKHDCISYPPFLGQNVWTVFSGGGNTAVPVHSRLMVGNLESACDAARAGVGIAGAFSYNVAAAIADGTLVEVLRDFQPQPLPISLIYPANRFMPVKLRAFLDFAVPRLKERLVALPPSMQGKKVKG